MGADNFSVSDDSPSGSSESLNAHENLQRVVTFSQLRELEMLKDTGTINCMLNVSQ